MKYTPAPWKATRSDPAEGVDCWWITADTLARNFEKEVASVPGGYPRDTCEANARLIAAAPDMLAALKLARGELPLLPDPHCNCRRAAPCNDCVEYGHARDVEAAVVAAITKAEGK